MASVLAVLIMIFCGLAIFGKRSISIGNEEKEKSKQDLLKNLDFENELSKKLANPIYKQEILEIIKNDLSYIYGNDWKELFNGPWYTPNSYSPTFDSAENIVFFLMLSKSGLIPFPYQIKGIKIGNFEIANAYECLKILHCVEKNIVEKRGSDDYKLVFNPLINRERYGKHPSPEIPRYEYPCSGDFNWAFKSFHYNFPHVIRDIHSPLLVRNCKNCSTGKRSNKEKNNPYKDKLII